LRVFSEQYLVKKTVLPPWKVKSQARSTYPLVVCFHHDVNMYNLSAWKNLPLLKIPKTEVRSPAISP